MIAAHTTNYHLLVVLFLLGYFKFRQQQKEIMQEKRRKKMNKCFASIEASMDVTAYALTEYGKFARAG